MMRQKINFSFVFMKQFDLNEFESELKINVNDEKKNFFMTEQI